MKASEHVRLVTLSKTGGIIFFLLGILIAFSSNFGRVNNAQFVQALLTGGIIGGCIGIGIAIIVHHSFVMITSIRNNLENIPEHLILIGQFAGSIEGIVIGYFAFRWIGAGNGVFLGWIVGEWIARLSWLVRRYHLGWTLFSFIFGLLLECIGGLIIRSMIIMFGNFIPITSMFITLLLLEICIVVYLALSRLWCLLKERQ